MTESLLSQIQGSWLLVSMTYDDNAGNTVHLYGENPYGILTYDSSGYMNAQMGFHTRGFFKSDSLSDGSTDEIIGAYTTYMAYYGKYWEKSRGVLIHQVTASLFPNWQGKEEIRYATIEKGLLVITTPPTLVKEMDVVIKAVWQRP